MDLVLRCLVLFPLVVVLIRWITLPGEDGPGFSQGAGFGLIIGIIQQLSDNRIEAAWTPAIVFAYLVLILVFRPQGLLGEKTREAG